MSIRKLVVAAGVLLLFAWIWSRLRGDAEVDTAVPTASSAGIEDAVSAAVGTPPPDPSASA